MSIQAATAFRPGHRDDAVRRVPFAVLGFDAINYLSKT
jgi:hypothetical protein